MTDTTSTSRVHHLSGDRRRRGRPPVAVFRAVTRADRTGSSQPTLSQVIRSAGGFEAVAAAAGIDPEFLRTNIGPATRGVRPEHATAITDAINTHRIQHGQFPLFRRSDLFIDTRPEGEAVTNPYPELDAMPLLLTVRETADLLRVSPEAVRQMTIKGQLACTRIGTRRLIPREALRDLLTAA